ncbi:hypothetical protein GCM10022282_15540 [Agromyces indicus]
MDTDDGGGPACQSERMPHQTHPAASDVRRWPSDPAMLVDTTRCPSCFSQLFRTVCDTCGLRLDVPLAAEALAAGARVRDAEAERQVVLSRMRAQQAAAAARPVPPPPPAVAAPVVDAVPAPLAPPLPPAAPPLQPVSHPPATAPQVAPPQGETPLRARRSGVQVLLLTLGVVLLSVAAVVFLLVAYLIATLEVRSVVIAVASVPVLGVAWLLRARGLPGTAEGVAALAVVLLILDVWIVQANDLFLSDRVDAPGYWGTALLVLAALLAAARLVTAVRVTGIAAAVLAPTGLGIFMYGIAPRGESATGVWLGGLAVLLAGAAARFGRASIERTLLVSAGLVGGATALVAAPWALGGTEWGATWALAGVAGGWLVMLVALRARSTDAWPRLAPLAAALAGIAAAAAPALGAAIELDERDALWAAPTSAAVIACLAAAAARLRASWFRDGFTAFVASGTTAMVAAVPALLVTALAGASLATVPFRAWTLDATAPRPGDDGLIGELDRVATGAVLAPAALGVAAAIAFLLLGRLRRLGAVPAALLGTAAVAAALTAPTPLAIAALLVGTALVALALAAVGLLRRVPGAVSVLAVFGMGSAVAAWALSHGSAGLWWWVVPVVLGLAIAGRMLTRRIWSSASRPLAVGHAAAAAAIVALAGFSLPAWSAAAGSALASPWDRGAFVGGLVAALALAGVAAVRPLGRGDRSAIAVPLLAAALVGSLAAASSTIASRFAVPDLDALPLGDVVGWVPATALVLVGLLWLRSPVPGLRMAFAAATPIALGLAGASVVAAYGSAASVVHGVAGAALLAAGLAHVLLPNASGVRAAWASAIGPVAIVAFTATFLPPSAPEQTWLALLILTPLPMLIAALWGDPVGGDSPARHLSWLSLPLAVGAVWTRFAADGVRDVEAYTLPLAVGLGVAGALLMWRRPAGATTAVGRTAVLGAAAVIAVLPSISAASGSELRALLLVSIGTVVLLAGLALPDAVRGVPLRLLVVTAGWAAVTGGAVVRGTAIATGASGALVPEVWSAAALAVGAIAAFAWSRTEPRPTTLAEWGLAASVTLASVPTFAAILDDDLPDLRAGLLLASLAAVHVASVAVRTKPLSGPILRWTTLGVLVLGALVVIAASTVDPFDLVTVPVGLGLIAAGAIDLTRRPGLGSWPALGPGLAVVLLPALLADWTDPQLWRVVGLGVAAVAAVVVGTVLRLQAPVLLGGAVLLVHALTQLWPWISALYEAVWWWLWLGLAGALLVVIAATYERQVRLARGAARTIAALR